jgi:hypothetical protein
VTQGGGLRLALGYDLWPLQGQETEIQDGGFALPWAQICRPIRGEEQAAPAVSPRFPTSPERVSAGVGLGVRVVLSAPLPKQSHARGDGRGRSQIRGQAIPLLTVGV